MPDIRVKLDDYERIRLVLLRTHADWDLQTLKGVLLALIVQNREEEEIFRHRFDAYFGAVLKDSEEALKILLLAEERQEEAGVEADRSEQGDSSVEEPTSSRRLRKVIAGLASLILLSAIGYGAYIYFRSPPPPPNGGTSPEQPGGGTEARNDEEFFLDVSVPEMTPEKLEKSYKDYISNAGLVALPIGFFLLSLWSIKIFDLAKRPEDAAPDPTVEPPPVDPQKPRLFRLGDIGGKPEPFIEQVTLNELADSLSYFQSEELSNRLDSRASVEAIGRNGGFPSLIFKRRKQLRTVYVLLDAYAEALAWNPVPEEFAEGMRQRGINVAFGRFFGSPTKFVMRDGSTLWLDEMENYRSDLVLLFFSDSKCLRPHRDAVVLKSLAHWPQVAWMELREPVFWDQSTAFVARHKVPLYPATATGLRRVMERFLTEKGHQRDYSDGQELWRGSPPFVETYLHDSVERLLGDALPWAQACSMIQPITQGLADALRRKFQPHLQPERIERLFRLPNTTASVAGLQFSTPVLAVLREGFKTRWGEEKQDDILRFIEKKVVEARPKNKGVDKFADDDSLAHLSWEMALERVRLERDPDTAVKRLEELALTPLEGAIRANLSNVVLPGEPLTEGTSLTPSRVPLRRRPEKEEGLKALSILADKINAFPGKETKKSDEEVTLDDFKAAAIDLLRKLVDRVRKQFAPSKQLKDFPAPDFAAAENMIELQLATVPSQLEFNQVKANRTYSQNLFILARVHDHTMKEFVENPPTIASDAGWIRHTSPFMPSLTKSASGSGEEAKPYYQVEVTIDTTKMKSGVHTAKLSISSLDVEKEVAVTVTVAESFEERMDRWWETNKLTVSRQISRSFWGVVLTALFLMFILPANWVNQLYNKPPTLEKIEIPDRYDKKSRQIPLVAHAVDADNDALEYQWQSGDTPAPNSTSKEYILDLPQDGSAAGEKQIKLQVRDARGGAAQYLAKVNVEEKPVEKPPDPVQDTVTTDSSTSTIDSPQTGETKLIALAIVYKPKALLGASSLTITDANGAETLHTLNDNVVEDIPLKPGPYQLRFVKDGYFPVEKSVTIIEKKTAPVTVEFTRNAKGRRISSTVVFSFIDEKGAPVILREFTMTVSNRPALSVSPDFFGVELSVGSHPCTVRTTGFKPWSGRIRVFEQTGSDFQSIRIPLKTDMNTSRTDTTVAEDEDKTLLPILDRTPNLASNKTLRQIVDLYNSCRFESANDVIGALNKGQVPPNVEKVIQQILVPINSIFKTGYNEEEYTSILNRAATVNKEVRGVYPPNYPPNPADDIVIIEVEIDQKGAVVKANNVLGGNSLLYEAAKAAAKQWVFSPEILDDKPSRSSQIIFILFAAPAGK